MRCEENYTVKGYETPDNGTKQETKYTLVTSSKQIFSKHATKWLVGG